MKIIRWVLLAPVLLVAVGVIGTELNKAYWDHKVRKWCENKGGVTVFETVLISKGRYLKNDGYKGMINIPPESTRKPRHDFYKKNTKTIIKKSNPLVVRSEYVTYRKSDEKQLGKWVTYWRSGGDFPTGFHPSSFSCGQISGFKRSAGKEIFIIETE